MYRTLNSTAAQVRVFFERLQFQATLLRQGDSRSHVPMVCHAPCTRMNIEMEARV